jgi:hypothetical protein
VRIVRNVRVVRDVELWIMDEEVKRGFERR